MLCAASCDGESIAGLPRPVHIFLILGVALAGCSPDGTTDKSGAVGDELSAKGLRVTVQRVDASVPVPARDITGLSTPAPGKSLVGVRARVCSSHGGAIGSYSFSVEPDGRLKFPAMNYSGAFESLRNGCGTGWIVFEVPRGTRPEKVRFSFTDTGSYRHEQDRVKARFTWNVS
jgi:hypothetical protein